MEEGKLDTECLLFFCKRAFTGLHCPKRCFCSQCCFGTYRKSGGRESLSLISSLTFGQNPGILALPADAFIPVADELSPGTAVESSYIALEN